VRKPETVLGLDIGGSSSRARLSAGGRILADASGLGANVAAVTPRVIEGRLTALIAAIGDARPVSCCAGSAGAEVPAGKRRLERFLMRLLPDSRVLVVHDARLVLAAAGLDAGIALIAGTGSVAYGNDGQGKEARAGGWGWLLGDEGGGAWMAREAVRVVMRRRDAGEPPGPLGEALFAATGARSASELAGRLLRMREAGQWAAVADCVFETAAQDAGSAEVIESGAEALARLVVQIGERVRIRGPVVLAGGLLLNQPRLESAVRARVGEAVRLEAPAVEGAVRLAEAEIR
jgi:glucosamine kinase